MMTNKTPRELPSAAEQAASYLASHGLATREVLLIRALREENEVLQKLSSDRAIQRTSLLIERDQLKAKLEEATNYAISEASKLQTKLEAAEKVIDAGQDIMRQLDRVGISNMGFGGVSQSPSQLQGA